MRKEDDPVVADELVEVDWTGGGVRFKIGRNATQAKAKVRGLVLSQRELPVKGRLTAVVAGPT